MQILKIKYQICENKFAVYKYIDYICTFKFLIENSLMDIVSRLKLFLDTYNIPNSQFADNCGIPRPTLSQLLNGRNKKISDEIISKIHARYPALSVMWLLFNEGSMVSDSNIQISEPQNDTNEDSFIRQSPEFKDHNTTGEQNLFDRDFNSENLESVYLQSKSQNLSDISTQKPEMRDFDRTSDTQSGLSTSSISVPTDGLKKITNIVVFYSDNSFQSFQPVLN